MKCAISRREALKLFSLFCCRCLTAPNRLIAQQSVPIVHHDSRRPFRAWVLCIDTSLSPEGEQFRKLQAIMESIAERDVTYNDLVWLIRIESSLEPVEMFEMPARSVRRSDGTAAADQLKTRKESLIAAIRNMSQVSSSTDLESSLNAALKILGSHPEAARRILAVGSDYIIDRGNQAPSLGPPKSSQEHSAKGVEALLLVTNPKPGYLRGRGISNADLLKNIETQWVSYLKAQDASPVTVLWVDAVPVTSSAAATSGPQR